MNTYQHYLTQNSWRYGAWMVLLSVVMAVGAYATYLRFRYGLGVTNLSDTYPWGLWIAVDVMGGVALAAGAFCMALTVYLLKIEKYKSVVRPAILTGLIGYLSAILGILFDLGQPHRIWHVMIFWQPNSVMFEVAWCVMLYTTVLILEFAPTLLVRWGWERLAGLLRSLTVPLVIAGVILSTLHQSSLGGLLLIAPDHVHPLWYSPLLPILFLLSAIAVAPFVVAVESILSSWALGRGLERDIVQGLGRAGVYLLVLYGAVRLGDLLVRGAGSALWGERSLFLWAELTLMVFLPLLLLSFAAIRRSPTGLLGTGLLVAAGVVLYRYNTVVTAKIVPEGVAYFPNWVEFAITAGIVAWGLWLYTLAVRHLPIFPPESQEWPTFVLRLERRVPVRHFSRTDSKQISVTESA